MATKNTTTSTDKTTTPKAADKAAAANPFADLFGNNPFGTTFGSDAWSTLIDRQIGFIQSVGAELSPLRTTTLGSDTIRQSRLIYRQAPSIPASVQSRSRSGGLSDNINRRAVSAPYSSMIISGSTTFRRDLLIFSDRPTVTD